MGKKRTRPSVIVPYHVYHFKDMYRDFDFVCLKNVKNAFYRVMMLNYSTTKANKSWEENYQRGAITYWRIAVGDVRFVEKSVYTENAIKFARLITL